MARRGEWMKATVIGARGFIGRHLADCLTSYGVECVRNHRENASLFDRDLGHVFYCAGLTADFRAHSYETVEAHCCLLNSLIRDASFKSFLYLSSCRVYQKMTDTDEDCPVLVQSSDPSDLYNLSKLTGEAVCLAAPRSTVRVARLSNIVGHDPRSENFLSAVIGEALSNGKVSLLQGLESAKDYLLIEDAVSALVHIAFNGRKRLYNVASGQNISHGEILSILAQETGCSIDTNEGGSVISTPNIKTARLAADMRWKPRSLIEVLPEIVEMYRREDFADD